MRIAIMGSGSVGGFYGGRMARAGEEVTFIERGAHLRALRESGLRVESPSVGDFTLAPLRATDDPGTIGCVDLALVTLKAYDLEEAARTLVPLIGTETVVLPLMNGVDIAERIGAVVGMEHMLGGLAYVSTAIAAPGLIRHVAMDRLVFGEPDGGLSKRGKVIREMMHGAGIEAELSENIKRDLWDKFLSSNAFTGVCALTRSPLGAVMEDPDTRRLVIDCIREAEAVARALGIELVEDVVAQKTALIDDIPAPMKPSMLVDLELGRKLELEALQGTVVRLSRELGLETPVNRFIYAALKLHAGGT